MADRTGKEASAADLWQGLKIRMDDRQASYRRSWLRAPVGEPAHQPGGKELFLLRFEGSAYFGEAVAPKLK